MSVNKLLSVWQAEPTIWENIASWKEIPALPAQFTTIPDELHPALAYALAQAGINKLYHHQRAVWQNLRDGRHLVIATGTASGKTLAYNLPIINDLITNPGRRALYLFPTKALAQDQLASLNSLIQPANQLLLNNTITPFQLAAEIYDGDTPSGQRAAIRKGTHIVLSNPDMLHTGILPHHTSWSEFFENLSFVVIDEMHVYRGVFGSHVANVIRRLKRIAQVYGTKPQFILTSATIANPLELASRLIEEEVQLVEDDGSARGPR